MWQRWQGDLEAKGHDVKFVKLKSEFLSFSPYWCDLEWLSTELIEYCTEHKMAFCKHFQMLVLILFYVYVYMCNSDSHHELECLLFSRPLPLNLNSCFPLLIRWLQSFSKILFYLFYFIFIFLFFYLFI